MSDFFGVGLANRQIMSSSRLVSRLSVRKCFHEIVIYLFGIFMLTNFIVLYTLCSPIFLLRLAVIKAAKYFRPDLNTIVNPQGNLFASELFSSKPPRSCLVVPIVFQGHFTLSEFRKRFANMVNLTDKETGKSVYAEYKQYVEKWFGFAFWKNDPNFDIQNHVSECNFDNYHNDQCFSSKDISNIVEQLLNKKFPQGRSPWDVCVANNYNDPHFPDGVKTVIIVRLHHTLADGFSLLYSLIEGVVQSNLGSLELPKPVYTKWEGLWRTIVFPIKLTHDLGDYFIKSTRQSVFMVPDRKKSWKMVYSASRPIPITTVKEIKDGLKVTFSSVLVAAVAAGMASWRKRKVSKETIGSDAREAFFFVLPLPGHPKALTNHATGIQMDLPMNNFPDPVLRVEDCYAQMTNQKSSTIPWLIKFLLSTLGYNFTSLAYEISKNRVNVSGLTNFSVGLNEIKLEADNGKVLSVSLAAGLLGGISGLGFMMISCGENIFLTATAETGIIKREELDEILATVRAEIDVLHDILKTR